MKPTDFKISFDDPRIAMTLAGRMAVRIIAWVFYLILGVSTFLLLISDIARLRWIGIGLTLFLIDRLIHRGEPDVPISELKKDDQVNIATSTQPQAFAVMERAFDRAVVAKHDFFLEATRKMLDDAGIQDAILRLDLKLDDFRAKLDLLIAESAITKNPSREDCLLDLAKLADAAFAQALAMGHNFVGLDDFFAAAAGLDDEFLKRLFGTFSLDAGDVSRALVFTSAVRSISRLPGTLGGFSLDIHRKREHRIMNRAWTSRPTPMLDHYAEDLTDQARMSQIGFLVGHEKEFDRLLETLGRPINPNAILVGEAGIGKESIVKHLAYRLTRDDVPQGLFDRRLVSLQLQNIVAGAAPEEFATRLKTIVEEITIAGNIILYIPDIHNLVHTSGTAYLSAADALMPIIMNNVFPIVGSTYPKEFKQLIEPRSDFVGAFEVIPVLEITTQEAERIISYEGVILEQQHKIRISFGAVKRAVLLAKKYMRGKFLPSSAEELLKSALIEAKARGEVTLGPDRVTSVAEAKVNIPMHEAGAEEAEHLLHLEDTIHAQLIGQDEAVKAVAESLREYRSGIARGTGPIASFLFVGPTGVGKTELAKILAKVQFGSEKMMFRFDMTEYQDKQSFFRLIGSPDGTVRGALTDAVLEKPYSLILLDEFEKAFPDILNLFLQVFDDGRLTDNLGRTVDFSNTIIIATSNAHQDIVNDALAKGESMADIADYLKSKLTDVFKPELVNRFTKIVIFKNLEPDQLEKIVLVNLAEITALVKEKGMDIEFDPAAVKRIAQLGFDPQFGARPLRRVIDEKLRAPLAEAILAKKIERGSKMKLVLKDENTFEFVKG